MPIAIGEHVPDVEFTTMTPEGPKRVRSAEALGEGKVVLFAVPGAFTPTCSDYHLPGFVLRASELRAKGVDRVACTAVNDVFVMAAWARDRGVGDSVLMLADGSADFARAMDLALDGSAMGLGTRSRRYAAILEGGVVKELMVEQGPGLDVSSADSVLQKL